MLMKQKGNNEFYSVNKNTLELQHMIRIDTNISILTKALLFVDGDYLCSLSSPKEVSTFSANLLGKTARKNDNKIPLDKLCSFVSKKIFMSSFKNCKQGKYISPYTRIQIESIFRTN